jgi:hypothetical protein
MSRKPLPDQKMNRLAEEALAKEVKKKRQH